MYKLNQFILIPFVDRAFVMVKKKLVYFSEPQVYVTRSTTWSRPKVLSRGDLVDLPFARLREEGRHNTSPGI